MKEVEFGSMLNTTIKHLNTPTKGISKKNFRTSHFLKQKGNIFSIQESQIFVNHTSTVMIQCNCNNHNQRQHKLQIPE